MSRGYPQCLIGMSNITAAVLCRRVAQRAKGHH